MSAAPAAVRLRSVAWRQVVPATIVVVAVTVWSVLTVGGSTGRIPSLVQHADWLPIVGPVSLGLALLLWRPHSPGWLKWSFGYALTIAIAVRAVDTVGTSYVSAMVPLAALATAAIVLRFPALSLAGIFLFAGAAHAIEVRTGLGIKPIELLIGAAWLALVWAWITGRLTPPRLLPLAVIPLMVYVVASLFHAMFTDPVTQGVFAWRISCEYMSLALLAALLCDMPDRRAALHRLVLLLIGAITTYAMLQWIFGASAAEIASARRGGPYVTDEFGEVRLFGAQLSPQALGGWAAMTGPFALASALSPLPAGWRLLGLYGAVTAVLAMFGADARTATVAGGVGYVTVLALFAASRGFTGRRALPLLISLIVASVGGGVFISSKLDDESRSAARFEGVFDPLNDFSVKGRFLKWETLLEDSSRYPLGHGLGTSGAAEVKYGRYTGVARDDPDSSYVKLTYDQGLIGLVVFAIGVLTLTVGLGVRTLRARDPVVAAIGAGATAALVALVVIMSALVFHEGLIAATAWLLAGMGLAVTGSEEPA